MGMGIKCMERELRRASCHQKLRIVFCSYISFRWEREWDGNGNEVIEMGGNWYEKSVPAAPPLWRREPATRSQSAYGERRVKTS